MVTFIKLLLIFFGIFVIELFGIENVQSTPPPVSYIPTWMTVLVVIFGIGFFTLLIFSIALVSWILKCLCFSRSNKNDSLSLTSQEAIIPDIIEIKKDASQRPAKPSDIEEDSNPKALQLSVNHPQNSDKELKLIADPSNIKLYPNGEKPSPHKTISIGKNVDKENKAAIKKSTPKLYPDIMGNLRSPYETLEIGNFTDKESQKSQPNINGNLTSSHATDKENKSISSKKMKSEK